MKKNYSLETGQYASADGRSTVAYYCFTPVAKNARAVVQISHGMCEYVMRYEALANYLTALGYVVCGNDHTGHGKSVSDEEELGLTGGAAALVEDVHQLTWIMRDKYPGLPMVLLGHSMGSFIARRYAVSYPGQTDGLIFVGTGGPGNPTAMGKLLAKAVSRIYGEKHRSGLITGIAFGSYNKRIPDEETSPSAWLSRDTAVVEAYDADPLCHFTFTAKGYYDLFDLLGGVSKPSWAVQVPSQTPVLLMSGDADPVGAYGRGVERLYRRLVNAHHRDVRFLLYEGMRHEIFNELGREKVFADLAAWLSEHNF